MRAVRVGLLVIGIMVVSGHTAWAADTCDLAGVKMWSASAASNDWNDANNWDPVGVPTSTTHVCINNAPPGGYVRIDSASSAASLETNQPIYANQTLTLASTTQASLNTSTIRLRSSGGLAGAGRLNVTGDLRWSGTGSILGTGVLAINPGGTMSIDAASTSGPRYLEDGRRVEVGGALSIVGPRTVYTYGTGEPRFQVLAGGSVTKSGSGAAQIFPPLENDGSIAVSEGQLQLSGGTAASAAITSSGSYAPAAGASLQFNGGLHRLAAFSQAGAGVVDIRSGEVNFNGVGSFNVPSGSIIEQSGGTLSGSGTLTIDGQMRWTGGSTMTGAGTTAIGAGGSLVVNADQSSGARYLGSGRKLTVAGQADIRGARAIYDDGSGTVPVLRVLAGGDLEKVSTGEAVVNTPVDNDGLVKVTTGSMQLNGTGSNVSTGDYQVATGTRLNLYGTTTAAPFKLQPGGGQLVVLGELRLNSASTTEIGSNLVLDGNGTLSGSGALTAKGKTELRNCTLSGAGGLTVPAGASLTIADSASVSLDKTLTIAGLGTFGEGGNIYNAGVGLLRVAAGGTLRKIDAASESDVYVPLDNDGAVRSEAGLLHLFGGSGTQVGVGTFAGITGGVVRLDGAFTTAPFRQLAGSGYVAIGGTLTLDGAGRVDTGATLLLDGGTITGNGVLTLYGRERWTGGSMTGNGKVTVAATGTLEVDGGYLDLERPVEVSGVMELRGPSTLDDYANGNSLRIFSTGVLKKTGGDVSTLYLPFRNDGTVDVVEGVLAPEDTFTNYIPGAARLVLGKFVIRDNGTLQRSGMVLTRLAATLVLEGDGAISDGASRLEGNINSVEATGVLELAGGRDLAHTGALTNSGAVVLGAGSRLDVSGNYTQTAATASLKSFLRGTDPATGFGRVVSGGTASIGGSTLVIDSVGFTPPAGSVFDIVTGSTLTGTFATVTGATGYTVSYTPTAVRLTKDP